MNCVAVMLICTCMMLLPGVAQAQEITCGTEGVVDVGPYLQRAASKSTEVIRVVYVDFGDHPNIQMNDNMRHVLWDNVRDYYARMSRQSLLLDYAIVEMPGEPNGLWTADSTVFYYGNEAYVAETARFEDYYIVGTGVTGLNRVGELQAEILLKIEQAYSGSASPFDGADKIAFVYVIDADANPIRGGIGGVGNLQVKKDSFSVLAGAAYDPGDEAAGGDLLQWRAAGLIANWWGAGALVDGQSTIIAHEYGHTIGLEHLSAEEVYSCTEMEDTGFPRRIFEYYYGVYGLMRQTVLQGRPMPPIHIDNLIRARWVDVDSVTASRKNFVIRDIRSGGDVYEVPAPGVQTFVLPGIVEVEATQGFYIALHSGNGDDGRIVPSGGAMYPDQGLAIWHYKKTRQVYPPAPMGITSLDLEVASGLWADPEIWQEADVERGYDTMDSWYDRQGNCITRLAADATGYVGSSDDFFDAVNGEFSYATNPNTFGWENLFDGSGLFRYHPQTVPNTILIRVKEDYGDSMLVDFLFAPYEDVVTPNGNESMYAGSAVPVTWTTERTVGTAQGIIDAVDILYSNNDGVTYTQVVTGVSAESGYYLWTPSLDDTTSAGRIKIVSHNVSDSTRVESDESDQAFSVVAPPVVYADRSARPDGTMRMPYQGLPYSSVTVDFDGAGPRDMVVSLLNDRAQLYAATQMTVDGGVPAYDPITDAFATGSKPDDVLGMAVADINGNGQEVLFGASQTDPRLYQLQGSAYVDMASTWGVATAALLSTTGAWADFDCDGDVDLAIGTSDCGAVEPGVYNAGPPVVDVLLRNDLITTGAFADVSVVSGIQTGIDPEYYSNSTTVTWGDINDDGYPDLFIGEFGEPASGPPSGIDCRLFVNQCNGTFIDEADSLIGTQQAIFTIAGIWRDMDNDGDLDLELAKKTKRLSLRYDTGTGLVSMDDSEDDGQYSGLRIYDHDLDGYEDVLLLPSVASDVPRLLAGTADGGDVSYTNVTAATGIAIPGKIGGAVAADLNGDGDIDLFLGREPEKDAGGAYLEGDQYLFQAKSQSGAVDAPANNWLSIRLQSASGMNNRMGIGAKVRVYDAGRQRVRLVDGGSGRGGQDDPTMVFGLGAGTTVDSVTVDWPNGYHQVVAGGSLNIWTGLGGNGANVIADASALSVVAKAVTGTYEFAGGSTVDWVFSWETPLKTNPALDRVIFDNLNMAPECAQQVDEIGPDGSDVVQTVEMLANGRQHHVLKWLNRPCMPGCVIKFSVRSGINSNEIESAVKSFSMRFCPTN